MSKSALEHAKEILEILKKSDEPHELEALEDKAKGDIKNEHKEEADASAHDVAEDKHADIKAKLASMDLNDKIEMIRHLASMACPSEERSPEHKAEDSSAESAMEKAELAKAKVDDGHNDATKRHIRAQRHEDNAKTPRLSPVQGIAAKAGQTDRAKETAKDNLKAIKAIPDRKLTKEELKSEDEDKGEIKEVKKPKLQDSSKPEIWANVQTDEASAKSKQMKKDEEDKKLDKGELARPKMMKTDSEMIKAELSAPHKPKFAKNEKYCAMQKAGMPGAPAAPAMNAPKPPTSAAPKMGGAVAPKLPSAGAAPAAPKAGGGLPKSSAPAPSAPGAMQKEELTKGVDEKGQPIRGSNKRLQQAKVFGTKSDVKTDKKGVQHPKIPDANGKRISPQRMKIMQHLKSYAQKKMGANMVVAEGKRDETGKLKNKAGIDKQPFDVFTPQGHKQEAARQGKINAHNDGLKVGQKPMKRVDPKPDHRSGNLETQPSPDAAVHEIAHEALAPQGMNMAQHQTHMDKQWGESQSKYGHMQQKKTAGEVQPMAAENPIRRELGLPANRTGQKVADPRKPVEQTVDGTGARFNRAQVKGKPVDLMRQSRLLSPENKARIEQLRDGRLKHSPEGIVPGTSVDAKINQRAADKKGLK